jgi:hypothetical protein
MQKGYEIVHLVQQTYRGLPVKLSRITGTSDQWHRSHGYAPASDDSNTNGNKSGVDAFMTQCEQYEAGEPGAGRMLSDKVHNELSQRFAEKDLFTTTQSDLHINIIDETCDVEKWLAKFNIDIATKNELLTFENECAEAIGAIMDAQARARARIKMIEMSRRNGYATNGAGK